MKDDSSQRGTDEEIPNEKFSWDEGRQFPTTLCGARLVHEV